VFSKCYSAEGAKFKKFGGDLLLCNTLTVDLPSITDLTFNGFRDFTCQADFTIAITLQIIRCKVMIANTRKTIINNVVQFVIMIKSKLLTEFFAVNKIENVVHWGGVFPYVANIRHLRGEHKGACDTLRTVTFLYSYQSTSRSST